MTKPARTVRRARRLRREMSLPEVCLWRHLRLEPESMRFRRQHPLGPWVVDFHCAAAKLVVEVDGEAHDVGDSPERDAAKDECCWRMAWTWCAYRPGT